MYFVQSEFTLTKACDKQYCKGIRVIFAINMCKYVYGEASVWSGRCVWECFCSSLVLEIGDQSGVGSKQWKNVLGLYKIHEVSSLLRTRWVHFHGYFWRKQEIKIKLILNLWRQWFWFFFLNIKVCWMVKTARTIFWQSMLSVSLIPVKLNHALYKHLLKIAFV